LVLKAYYIPPSPSSRSIGIKFALWIMSCVDDSTSTLVIGDHIRIKFTKEDVGNVLGIPCSVNRVLDNCVSTRDSKDKVVQEFVGYQFKEQRSIKVVQELIERPYIHPMSKQEEDTFRVVFVVFVASRLLSLSSKHD